VLPEDGPVGPKHVGAILKHLNTNYSISINSAFVQGNNFKHIFVIIITEIYKPTQPYRNKAGTCTYNVALRHFHATTVALEKLTYYIF
jgi:hypothetical protein